MEQQPKIDEREIMSILYERDNDYMTKNKKLEEWPDFVIREQLLLYHWMARDDSKWLIQLRRDDGRGYFTRLLKEAEKRKIKLT
jgi:hypothetical protein